MQGKKGKERKLFYIASLNQLVPADHPVRRISEVLDRKSIHTETRQYYSHEEKPSIDPVVLFKLNLIGHFFRHTLGAEIVPGSSGGLPFHRFIYFSSRCIKGILPQKVGKGSFPAYKALFSVDRKKKSFWP